MKNINLLILQFLLLLFSIESLASVGKVTLVKGEVWAVRGQDKHILAKDDDVHSNDEIITQKSSLLKIKMNDDTLLVIGPHSHFVLEDVKLNKKGEGKSTYDITYGFIRSKFTRKKKKGEVTFKTKNVSMGIRGTEFIVEVHNKDGKPHSKIALLRGNIDVEAFHPDKKKIHKFKLKKDHEFNSHVFEEKGIKHAHKRLSKKHLTGLNKNKVSFLHDVRHKGKPYPKYELPKKFKKLKPIIRKKQDRRNTNRSKSMRRDNNPRRDNVQRRSRNQNQMRKMNKIKKDTQQKKKQQKLNKPKK